MRPTTIFCGVLLSACLATPQTAWSDEAADHEKLFETTAADVGRSYLVGRTYLESQGAAVKPIAERAATSADHRRRELAQLLLLNLAEPARVAALRASLKSWSADTFFLRPKEAHKEPPPGMAFDRGAVPVLIDYLRATADLDFHQEPDRRHALSLLAGLADADTAPALVETLGYRGSVQVPIVEESLKKLGPAAFPSLRRALAEAPVRYAAPGDVAVNMRNYAAILLAGRAAQALARFGDRDAVPLIIERLQASRIDSQQTELARALALSGDSRGVPPVFELLLDTLRNVPFRREQNRSERERPKYDEIRAALLSFGPAAKDFLAKQVDPQSPLDVRVVAESQLFELEHPAEAAKFYETIARAAPPDPFDRTLPGLAVEPQREPTPEEFAAAGRAAFWWEARYGGHDDVDRIYSASTAALVAEHVLVTGFAGDLDWLARTKQPAAALEVLVEVCTKSRAPETTAAALRALAERQGERAVAALGELARMEHVNSSPALVEAALLVADPAAVALLDQLRLPDAAELVKSATPAVRGDEEALRKLLGDKRPMIRIAAARRLLTAGDRDATAVLLDAQLPTADDRGLQGVLMFSFRQGPARRARNELVRGGLATLAALAAFRGLPPGAPRRVLADAIALRIQNPDLAATFDRAIHYRSRGFQSRGGPDTGDYQFSGKYVADQVGEAGAPLLAAEVVGLGYHGEIAAFALATFRRQSDLELLVGVLRDVQRDDRLRGLVALAIRDFGPDGVAAIKDIPAPDPDRPAFNTRAGRSRAATSALADIDPQTAVANIVHGLNALADPKVPRDDKWAENASGFFRLAWKLNDPALIEPILKVLALEPRLDREAFQSLLKYEDPRLTEPALAALLADDYDPESDQLVTLMRQLRGETAARLVREVGSSQDAARRARCFVVLAAVVGPHAQWHEIDKQLNYQTVATSAVRKKSCNAALATTLAGLDDADSAVQTAAAKTLTALADGVAADDNDRVIRRLLSWTATRAEKPEAIVRFLVQSPHPDVKPALLEEFRRRNRRDYALLAGFALAEWPEAVPEVYASLEAAVGDRTWVSTGGGYHLRVFEKSYPDGWARLHDVVRDPKFPLPLRVSAVVHMARGVHQYPQAFDDVRALRDEVLRVGDDDELLRNTYVDDVNQRDDPATKRRKTAAYLTLAAAKLDHDRGYDLLINLLPTLPAGDYRTRVAELLEQMQKGR
jgi:hypothetical protein